MKTIDSNSWIYKLYAAQLKRTTGLYYAEDIAKRPTNICDLASRAFKQAAQKFFEVTILVLLGVIVGFLILVPLLTFGFYWFTDNPFIVWFGGLGEAVLVAEGIMVVACVFVGTIAVLALGFKKSNASLGFTGFVSTWFSNKFEGICTPLKIKVIEDDNT